MRWFFAVVLLGVLSTISTACSSSGDDSNITIEVKKITLSEISFELDDIETAFQISNDNKTGATLDKIEYKIYLGHSDKWIFLGLGERESVEIEAGTATDLVVSIPIEKKQLSESMTDKMLGAKPTKIKIDGSAQFEVGSESFEIQFKKVDNNPYQPTGKDETAGTEPVGAGTKENTNE